MQTVLDQTKSVELYRKEWDASPEIREEFGGDFGVYSAYRLGEDQGLISPGKRGKHRLSTLQLLEKIKLEWEVQHSVRSQFGTFDSYRRHRWAEEMAGR
jgi:hypothetical protein